MDEIKKKFLKPVENSQISKCPVEDPKENAKTLKFSKESQ